MSRPLCIDLYCGLGGWAEGFLAEGFDVVGFDIEPKPYPGQLVIQDVRTLDGAQFAHAAVIVGSSPCQEFSYRAMPWRRAKALPPPIRGIQLFAAQFRIQMQASERAGRRVPMVVENVCGAQRWIGRARWHYGSYYLWGDVPALMPYTASSRHKYLSSAAPRLWRDREVPRLNQGHAALDDGVKAPGLNWNGSDRPDYKARAFNTTAEQNLRDSSSGEDGMKGAGASWFGPMATRGDPRECSREVSDSGVKQAGLPRERWFNESAAATHSRGDRRKAASAAIAKIPFDLAHHIAQCFKPPYNPESENGQARRSNMWCEALGWQDALGEEAWTELERRR